MIGHSRSQTSRGLTLLEMILALFLFAILVPLFAGIWPIHHRAVSQGKASLCANHICRQVLEDVVSTGFDGVDALAATPTSDRTITLVTEKTDSMGRSSVSQDFVWNLQVETDATDTSLNPGEKLVRATVDWEDVGKPRQYTMTTLLAEAP